MTDLAQHLYKNNMRDDTHFQSVLRNSTKSGSVQKWTIVYSCEVLNVCEIKSLTAHPVLTGSDDSINLDNQ
jgi:hypothetical protein